MEEYRLDRHLKLWDSNNKRLTRVLLLSLVLAVSLFIKVLDPFVVNTEKSKPYVEEIKKLQKLKSLDDEKFQFLVQVAKRMQDVRQVISSKPNPWEMEKDKLIQKFHDMNQNPPVNGYSRQDYYKVANKTIYDISDILRKNIIQPLKTINDEAKQRSLGFSRLSAEIEAFTNFNKAWENHYLNKLWFGTLHDKAGTMERLTRDINQHLRNIDDAVKTEMGSIITQRTSIQVKLDNLRRQIEQEQTKLAPIEKALEEVLPQWLRGLVFPNQVIQIMPLGLVCLSCYVLFTGLILTHHYQEYINGKQLNKSLFNEASMSSLWTIIPRGTLGTLQTVAVYMLAFIVMWVMFEQAMSLLLKWLSIDLSQAWIQSADIWTGFRWLSRLIFLGLISYVLMLIWRSGFRYKS